MSNGMWFHTEDVLRDLGGVEDIDDGFLAVGAMPPRRPAFKEDESEIELLLGQKPKAASINETSEVTGSDLKGITKMIRMVQDYENTIEDDIAPKTEKDAVITISKLNPNVKAFVPRGVISPPVQDKNEKPTSTVNTENGHGTAQTKCTQTIQEENKKSHNPKTVSENINKTEQTQALKSTNNIKTPSTCEKSTNAMQKQSTETDFKKMAALLKNQISSAAKEDSFEKAKEKNTAIAKLLKLYAGPARNEITTKPKLYTPQFFEQCKASDYKKIDETNIPVKPIVHNLGPKNKINLLTPDKINKALINDDLASGDMEICSVVENVNNTPLKQELNVNKTSLTQELLNTNIDGDCQEDDTVIDPPTEAEVKDSISKVNEWLSKKPEVKKKPKSPSVYLGAVAFKRKESAVCKSPNEIVDKKISKASDAVYVPTKYAEELLKQYEERIDKKAQEMNVFDKLYHDLKKKDAEIRKAKKDETNA